MPGTARRLLLGTSTSGRGGDTGVREAEAERSLAALGRIQAVNVQFSDWPQGRGCIEVLRVLGRDARQVCGVDGPRKPLVTDILDALAAEAPRRDCTWIGLVNGDIVVTERGIDRLLATPFPAIAVARLDTGGDVPDAMLLYGVDMVLMERNYWLRERRRFRDYILGDPVWDNVYASIIACHGGVVLNREPLITHVRHESPKTSPYARYVHLLATRDGPYFSRWCEYVALAETLRARGGSQSEEMLLQRRVFVPPPAWSAVGAGIRSGWWRLRHWLSGPT